MLISELKKLSKQHKVDQVRFIRHGFQPMLIEVTSQQGNDIELLTDHLRQPLRVQSLPEAYAICRKAGIHQAKLQQYIPQDEACAGNSSLHQERDMTLRF